MNPVATKKAKGPRWARKPTNRNGIASRVTRREGGRIQVNLGQVKDVVAAYWDELLELAPEQRHLVISAELLSARLRMSKGRARRLA